MIARSSQLGSTAQSERRVARLLAGAIGAWFISLVILHAI